MRDGGRAAPGPRLDDDGIDLPASATEVLHLRLAGRRIWSFQPADHGVVRRRRLHVAWPPALVHELDGLADLSLHDDGGAELARTTVRFAHRRTDGPQPPDADLPEAVLADDRGNPLSLDHRGRLVGTFAEQGGEAIGDLLDALGTVIEALTECGVPAFPAYGTLLGAVREGRVIGHDDDADVGYLSHHVDPVDVVRESFTLQRRLHARGLHITRYSGAAFKIDVRVATGRTVGLDVFAGYLDGGHLAMMGEVFTRFERSWLLPLGEVVLEGRTFPAPARPEKLLEAMYGPGWRVPDPTFSFSTPQAVHRRFDGLFRGMRTYRNVWDRRYYTALTDPPRQEPHQLAQHLHRSEPEGTPVVEVGCGRGRDAMWLARRGHPVTAYDFVPKAYAMLAERGERDGVDVHYDHLNLLDQRQLLTTGARLALQRGPRVVLARHVLDATTDRGRRHFWRLAATLLGDGGRVYAEFMSTAPLPLAPFGETEYVDGLVTDLDPDVVAAEAEARGGRVVSQELRTVRGPELPARPAPGSPPPRATRMVVEWPA